jgi:predicted Zn-dependent protease
LWLRVGLTLTFLVGDTLTAGAAAPVPATPMKIPDTLERRYFVRRSALPLLLIALMMAPGMALSQASPPVSGPPPSGGSSGTQKRSMPSEPVAPEVTAAESAIASTDWKTAEAKLDSWLAAHPDDARALFDAGYVADVQNRTDDATSLYRRAVKADPNSFDAHLMLGMLLARQGKIGEARPEIARATQLDPGEGGPELKARAWRALARIDSNSNPSDASNDLLEALKLSPETTEDTLLAATLAEKTGQVDAAEREYRRVLAKDPQSEQASTGLAHLLIQQKKYPEAETMLRAALKNSPNDAALTAQLAAVLAAQDKAEALPLLQKLHEVHPDDAPITRMLAEVLADAGNFAASDEFYVKLLAASPSDPGLLVGHGQDLVRQMKYAAAFEVFDKATQIDPKNADGWSGLAFTASRTDRPAITLHALTMRSQLLPDNPSTYFLWATAYDSLHEKAQAAAYYHHFLDSSAGKFPDQEWQARQRLKILER